MFSFFFSFQCVVRLLIINTVINYGPPTWWTFSFSGDLPSYILCDYYECFDFWQINWWWWWTLLLTEFIVVLLVLWMFWFLANKLMMMMNSITNRVHRSFTTTTAVLKQRLYSIYSRKWNIWVMRCGSFPSGNTQTPNCWLQGLHTQTIWYEQQ